MDESNDFVFSITVDVVELKFEAIVSKHLSAATTVFSIVTKRFSNCRIFSDAGKHDETGGSSKVTRRVVRGEEDNGEVQVRLDSTRAEEYVIELGAGGGIDVIGEEDMLVGASEVVGAVVVIDVHVGKIGGEKVETVRGEQRGGRLPAGHQRRAPRTDIDAVGKV